MKFIFSFFKNKKSKKQSGFSLIELLVVIMIVTVMTSISMFNYDEFGKSVELDNDSYMLALYIRESQVYGVNKKARDANEISKTTFGEDYRYGMYFNIDNAHPVYGVDTEHFVMYIDGYKQSDCPGNVCEDGFNTVMGCNFAGGNTNECVSSVTLNKGNNICALQIIEKGNSNWITLGSTGWTTEELDIQFKRPNPDAIIRTNNTEVGRARIVVKDSIGKFKGCVEVGVAGDISIRRDCDPSLCP